MQRSASVSAKYIAISVVYYIYSGTQHGYCDRLKQEKKKPANQ